MLRKFTLTQLRQLHIISTVYHYHDNDALVSISNRYKVQKTNVFFVFGL